MDSTEVRVHGRQEHSAYNGHFESTCYHPLLLFNSEGDCLARQVAARKRSQRGSWEELLIPEIERQRTQGKEVVLRADAAFAKPELYEALEEREAKYAIRLPANDNLKRNIRELLTRPVRTARLRTRCLLQGLSLSGGELEDGTGGGGEGRVPLRGIVSSRGLHRDQTGDLRAGRWCGSITSVVRRNSESKKVSKRSK